MSSALQLSRIACVASGNARRAARLDLRSASSSAVFGRRSLNRREYDLLERRVWRELLNRIAGDNQLPASPSTLLRCVAAATIPSSPACTCAVDIVCTLLDRQTADVFIVLGVVTFGQYRLSILIRKSIYMEARCE